MRPLVYTVADVQNALRISRSNFYRLAKTGRLRTKRLNGRRIVLAKDLDEFLEALPDDLGPTSDDPTDA